MLLQFSVENYLSFMDEVCLSMVPVKSRTMKEHLIIDEQGKKTSALPVALIYGANASGKTNLVKAISFAKKLIETGTRTDESIGVVPFLLDPEKADLPSRFEFVFKHAGVVYTFGFVVSENVVHEEWLFAYYSTQESRLYERRTTNGRTEVRAGQKLINDVKSSQFIEFIAKGTRPNQLFLTEANEKNVEILQPIFMWFRDNLHVIHPESKYKALPVRAHDDKDFIQYLSDFLKLADTGIQEITCVRENFDSEKHLQDLPDHPRNALLKLINNSKTQRILFHWPDDSIAIFCDKDDDSESKTVQRLLTSHQRTDGSTMTFKTSYESDGTRRLIDLVSMLQDIPDSGHVFIIDELDRSLHTSISRLFIEVCLSEVSNNQSNRQFIMTTHDTNLLDRKLLRRDEIWFIEKNKSGASKLASLTEFKVSEGLNYEIGYLNGRFGAIPLVGDAGKLVRTETD